MTTILIAIAGLITGLGLAWVVYHFCFRSRNNGGGLTEEMLEDIARRARIIRQGSEDIETRIARLQELRRIRERLAKPDDHNESEEG